MKIPKKILKIRNERGVTIASLTVTIIVLSILASIIITYTRINVRAQNFKAMQVDIKNLEDKVAAYYAINDDIDALLYKIDDNNIKINPLGQDLDEIQNMRFQSDGNNTIKQVGATDVGGFYIINLTAIDNLTLSFGKDFDSIKANNGNIGDKRDFYIINEASHNIFYVKGIQLAGENFVRYTSYLGEDSNNVTAIETINNEYWSLPYNEKNGTYRDKNGDVAYIPVDCMVSKEYDTIQTGLKIKDNNDKEYIWIPIPKIMEKGEPINEKDDDFVEKIEKGLKQYLDKPETNYTDQGERNLYNNMLEGIYKNGGFWISTESMDKTTNNLNDNDRNYITQKRYDIQKDLANTFFVENKIKNNVPEDALIDTEPEKYMIYNEDDNNNRLVIYFET